MHIPRSVYYYRRNHPRRFVRPELHNAVREIFGRTPNGCGHRQIAMCLRAEMGITIANKTVLKIMHELQIRCLIRRKRKYRRYSSYKGTFGASIPNLLARQFAASGPWEKLGTDVTEFSHPWGKCYLAPIYDFASKEIVAWSISQAPNMQQQLQLLAQLASKLPKEKSPILHSDMGWQYQQPIWRKRLMAMGIRQSMSRKGNCLDNAATEQVFGHLKDEFYRGKKWSSYKEFAEDLNRYIIYWNTQRRQMNLKGLTPEEFRCQST